MKIAIIDPQDKIEFAPILLDDLKDLNKTDKVFLDHLKKLKPNKEFSYSNFNLPLCSVHSTLNFKIWK